MEHVEDVQRGRRPICLHHDGCAPAATCSGQQRPPEPSTATARTSGASWLGTRTPSAMVSAMVGDATLPRVAAGRDFGAGRAADVAASSTSPRSVPNMRGRSCGSRFSDPRASDGSSRSRCPPDRTPGRRCRSTGPPRTAIPARGRSSNCRSRRGRQSFNGRRVSIAVDLDRLLPADANELVEDLLRVPADCGSPTAATWSSGSSATRSTSSKSSGGSRQRCGSGRARTGCRHPTAR